jgi:hypothetical protein
MRTREIPPEQWPSICEQLSRIHHGTPANLITISRDLGVQTNVRNLPLMGLTAEPPGCSGRHIELMLGEAPDAHVVHTIERPSHLRVAEWNDDSAAALQIESEDGWVTLLQVGPEREVLAPDAILDDIIL